MPLSLDEVRCFDRTEHQNVVRKGDFLELSGVLIDVPVSTVPLIFEFAAQCLGSAYADVIFD